MTTNTEDIIQIEEPREPDERLNAFASEVNALNNIRATRDDHSVTVAVVNRDDSVSTSLSTLFDIANRYLVNPESGHFGDDAAQFDFKPIESV